MQEASTANHANSYRVGKVTAALLLASSVALAGYLLFPARPATEDTLPALPLPHNASLPDRQQPTQHVTSASLTGQAHTTRHQDRDAVCNPDAHARTLQHYRQLPAQQWRDLNQWQQERGLSQTRLRADQELMQEPSPYLQYDVASLQPLAATGDADAQYWLAVKYRASGAAMVATTHGNEEAQLVMAALLQQAASAGHVPAMLAISERYHAQAGNGRPAPIHASTDFPDLQIKARAWARVAAWRLGRLVDASSALPQPLESQAAQLAEQLINDLQQQRQQQGLPAFDNVVPDAVIGLLQAGSATSCQDLAEIGKMPQPPMD